jgi:hypothetical protein
MGNSLTLYVQNVQLFACLIYRVIREKLNVALYGRLSDVAGPVGLTLTEIQEFESQFMSFGTTWKRRYGHRLDKEVHSRLKLTFVGGEQQEVDPDSYVNPRVQPEKLPVIVPLDQLHFNTNTVNAVALLVQYYMGTGYLPSRLFLYYHARSNPDSLMMLDEGVSFSDVFAVINLAEPVPDESRWQYSGESINQKPRCDSTEAPYVPYVGVQLNPALSNLKTCLKLNGPFVAAVSVTKDFELHGTYTYTNSEPIEGYQPLLFTTFSEDKQTFTAVNSFGFSWGNRGTVQLHVADLYKDPVFTNAIYTLVPDVMSSDEEKSD